MITLYKLAEIGVHPKEVKCSTAHLGEKLGISQQTASRYLIELEKNDLIKRSKFGRKESIQITKKGFEKPHLVFILRVWPGLKARHGQPPQCALTKEVQTG